MADELEEAPPENAQLLAEDVDIESLQSRESSGIPMDAATASFHDEEFKEKLFFCVLFTVAFPIYTALKVYHHAEPEEAMSEILLIWHLIYFGKLYHLIYHSKLHRIILRYKTIEGRPNALVVCQILAYPELACNSIAEFCNIRGGVSHIALIFNGVFTFVVSLTIFLYRLPISINSTSQTLAAVFSLGAGTGLTILGFFDLNPTHCRHKLFHVLGVTLCLISMVGLTLDQMFSVYCLIFAVPSVIGYSAWMYFQYRCFATLPSKEEEYVNLLSKKCIVAESIVLLFGCISFDFYVFLLTKKVPSFWHMNVIFYQEAARSLSA